MGRRRWEFMNQYPSSHYPPIYPDRMTLLREAMEEKEWWEKLEKSLKKEDKPKGGMNGTMNLLQVFLLLVGTSPFVAIIYKVLIIPLLLK